VGGVRRDLPDPSGATCTPVYRLFWFLTVVVTSHWVLSSNATLLGMFLRVLLGVLLAVLPSCYWGCSWGCYWGCF